MSTNNSANLSKKLGVYLEDAVIVFELLKMPTNKSAKLFDKLGVHLEDAVNVFELLKTELDTTSSSSKATNTDMFEELNAQMAVKEEENEISNLGVRMEEENIKLKVENERLATDNSKLKNETFRVEDELKESVAELEHVKNEIKSLQADNIKLRNQVDQLRSEISDGHKTNEAELKKSKVENERLATDNSKLKNETLRVEDELKESVSELEQVKNEIKALQADKNKIVEEEPRREKSGNPEVFFDMDIRGVFAGRIIFELFADIIPDHVELFRAFCTGEKGVSQKGIPLHYKGMSVPYFHCEHWMLAGNIGSMNTDEAKSIYGDMKSLGKEFIKKSTIDLGDLFIYSSPDMFAKYSFLIYVSTKPIHQKALSGGMILIGKIIQGIEVVHTITKALFNQAKNLGEGELVIVNSGQL